jgi:SAM-dependent methyltransferase
MLVAAIRVLTSTIQTYLQVRAFIVSLPERGLVADVGCGNGKYFGVRPDLTILASDRSPRLAEVAARRLVADPLLRGGPAARADVAVADALGLPYRDRAFDGVLCIAVR